MAQRQLTSLLRRARRPISSSTFSLHLRGPLSPRPSQLFFLNKSCCDKVGNRFFSAPPRPPPKQAGGTPSKPAVGKGTESLEKASAPQKQGSGKSTPGPSPVATKVVENKTESNGSSRKSSPSYFLIVGGCAAIVIGLLTVYPKDLLKGLNYGKKGEADPVSKSDTPMDVALSSTSNSEKEGAVADFKFLPKEVSDKGFGQDEKHAQNRDTEHIRSDGHLKILSATADKIRAESTASGQADDTPMEPSSVDEHNDLAFSLKDEASQSNEQELPGENLKPTIVANEAKIDQLPVLSEEATEVPLISEADKEPESLYKELVNEKSSEVLQVPSNTVDRRPSLLEAYHLTSRDGSSAQKEMIKENEDTVNSVQDGEIEKVLQIKGRDVDGVHDDTVHTALDLLELVHAAEHRQAALDARHYAEAQQKLKQAFHQELKDAQAKELMYAEEANRLAKEIELEKERAMVALELERKNAGERLHKELKHKEEEIDLKLKKAELLAKTQIAAAVAEEKLSYLRDVKDVKQELEALYMAFFTQSEDVRLSHTVHKLAVGTFALEDAMKRGAPIEKEVTLLCCSYGGVGSDPLLDAVLSSLPKEVVEKGTMTPAQLHQKFEIIKSGILELSLLPATGGGLLSHAAAKIVKALKVKENGHYSDGIDGVVSQVQRCLADGKLADAADLLEKSVHGTEAEALVADWIKSARNRAVMEQVLLLLQAHATAVASSLA